MLDQINKQGAKDSDQISTTCIYIYINIKLAPLVQLSVYILALIPN